MSVIQRYYCLYHDNINSGSRGCHEGYLRMCVDLPSLCEMVPCEVHYS